MIWFFLCDFLSCLFVGFLFLLVLFLFLVMFVFYCVKVNLFNCCRVLLVSVWNRLLKLESFI